MPLDRAGLRRDAADLALDDARGPRGLPRLLQHGVRVRVRDVRGENLRLRGLLTLTVGRLLRALRPDLEAEVRPHDRADYAERPDGDLLRSDGCDDHRR